MARVGQKLDREMCSTAHLASGHTIEHLLAATPIYQLYGTLREVSSVGRLTSASQLHHMGHRLLKSAKETLGHRFVCCRPRAES